MGRHARPHILGRAGKVSLTALGVAGIGVMVTSGLGLKADLGSTAAPADKTQVSTSLPTGGPTVPTTAPSPAIVPAGANGTTATTALYPIAVSIPAAHIQATLQMLSLNSSGALNPPTDLTQAGWYTGSSVPGQPGPAVLAGHVDSTTGPAVFYRLEYLRAGDTITVTLSDQSTVQFVVTAVASYPKDDFPTTSVYGPVPDPELRVITCGGSFANGHYLNNIVVYAKLADSQA